jgi:hypothetical protein
VPLDTVGEAGQSILADQVAHEVRRDAAKQFATLERRFPRPGK